MKVLPNKAKSSSSSSSSSVDDNNDSDSDAWNSDSSNHSSYLTSSDDDDENDHTAAGLFLAPLHTTARVFRRRTRRDFPEHSNDSISNSRDDAEMKHKRSHRCHRWKLHVRDCAILLGLFSTYMLCFAILLWIITALFSYMIVLHDGGMYSGNQNTRVRGRKGPSAPTSSTSTYSSLAQQLWSDVTEPLLNPPLARIKRQGRENLREGCIRPEWQEWSFPNCNEIHEIDLWNVFVRSTHNATARIGYLDQGLWRSVWAVDPRATMDTPTVVLKMMKRKHEVDTRNFDRHRRDALVMERLTSSPNVVDIYSYCGNSMLTEYIPIPLDALIYDESINANDTGGLTTQTAEGRWHVAVDILKGLRALHEITQGPVIHADIQPRQFLIAPSGHVKLNDFNRCRFMGRKEHSQETCKIGIPSAPGKARSPEEYKDEDLDEKIDVYSTANVLFELLTKTNPWRSQSTEQAKKLIKTGAKPLIPEQFQIPGTLDALLANVTLAAYTLEPQDRPSAAELVAWIEKMIPPNAEKI